MKEPSVSIQMIVQDLVTTTVAGQNIAVGTIIAECGTLLPKVYYSSTELLKEFTKSGAISRTTDSTLIHAAAIADIMPVFVKRVYQDNGVRGGFAVHKSITEKSSILEFDFINFPEKVSDNRTYETTTDGITVSCAGTDMSISNEKVLTFSECRFTIDTKFSNLKFKFENDSAANDIQYLILTDETGGEEYVHHSKLSFSGNNLSVALGKEYSAGTSITICCKTSTTVELSSFEVDKSTKETYTKFLFKNGEPLKYKSTITFKEGMTVNNFAIKIRDDVYYNAVTGKTDYMTDATVNYIAVDGITRRSTVKDVIDAINALMKTEFIDYKTASTGTLYSTAEFDSQALIDPYTDSYEASEAVSSSNEFSIYLYTNNPSSADFTAQITKDTENEDLIDVTVVTAARTYEYAGATDPDYVNSYGANQFIENVNEYENIPFTIKVLGTTSSTPVAASSILDTPTIAFGAVNVVTNYDIALRREAFEELMEVDEVKPAFACPFGYNNNSYLMFITSFGPKNWVYTPVGMFVEKDDPEAIIANRPTIKTDYALVMAPHDKSTVMTDWVVDMSLEVAYLRKVESNKAKRCEFAPMMGKSNSTLEITKPSCKFKKSTREALLDANIMSLITRTSEDASWLNKNVCSGGHNTILSEDQNIRMACKINRDLDGLLEPILGKFNTEETRSRVLKSIRSYFDDNILNQIYSIDSYNPVCDESNNPVQIRANGQLVVDLSVTYLNAIYEVLVYHRALAVNSNEQ